MLTPLLATVGSPDPCSADQKVSHRVKDHTTQLHHDLPGSVDTCPVLGASLMENLGWKAWSRLRQPRGS